MGVHHILNNDGLGIAVTGMAIVFVVLVLVSLFIGSLPRLLPVLNGILPPAEPHHGAPMPSAKPRSPDGPESGQTDDVVVAIAYALRHHRGG